jgi:hypothetical protein
MILEDDVFIIMEGFAINCHFSSCHQPEKTREEVREENKWIKKIKSKKEKK